LIVACSSGSLLTSVRAIRSIRSSVSSLAFDVAIAAA